MNKTEWFSVDTPPARVGVYETQTETESDSDDGCGGPYYNAWSGKQWAGSGKSPEQAAKEASICGRTALPIFRWRGLRDPS